MKLARNLYMFPRTHFIKSLVSVFLKGVMQFLLNSYDSKKLLVFNQLMKPTKQLIWTHLGYPMNKILDKIYYIDFFDTMEEII